MKKPAQDKKKDPTPFRRLVGLFQDRFLESDTEAPDSGFAPNLFQILGFLAAPGILIGIFLMPEFMSLALRKPGPAILLALRIYHLFFPAYSFAVVTFATVFEWDTLFPDRRDFLVLGSFPLRVRDIFVAKFAALGWFLLILIGAVNLFPTLMIPAVSFDVPQVRSNGFLAVIGAQIGSTAGAAAFGFFAVAAFQGLLINILSPRIFRRVSPWIQVVGMSLSVASLVLYPVYAMLLARITLVHPRWLWYFPPFWFTGFYDLALSGGSALFASLGKFGIKALGVAVALFCGFWLAGFQRHYRRTLEAEDTSARKPRNGVLDHWISSPEELAIFQFSGRMLTRSAKHRLFLATYWSIGLSIGALFVIAIKRGEPALSEDGLRSLPFLITFIVLSGLRAGFQFPVDLHANWLFRITESRWTQIARRVSRRRVLINGLVPVVLLFVPYSVAFWGARAAIFDAAFQLTCGALLVEILFWKFETVPFTCSYFQGKTNLFLLFAAYVFGLSYYSFRLSDLEISLERKTLHAVEFLATGAVALALSRRRKPVAEAAAFEAGEPVIQTLDLT